MQAKAAYWISLSQRFVAKLGSAMQMARIPTDEESCLFTSLLCLASMAE